MVCWAPLGRRYVSVGTNIVRSANHEFLDVEVSEKMKTCCGKCFPQQKRVFLSKDFGSRYFVFHMVFGCGGAGSACTSPIFREIHPNAGLRYHFASAAPNRPFWEVFLSFNIRRPKSKRAGFLHKNPNANKIIFSSNHIARRARRTNPEGF